MLHRRVSVANNAAVSRLYEQAHACPAMGSQSVCVCVANEGKSWVEPLAAGRIKLHLFHSSRRLESTCFVWYNERLFTKQESKKELRENVTHTENSQHTHTQNSQHTLLWYKKVGLNANRIQEISLSLQDSYKIIDTMLLLSSFEASICVCVCMCVTWNSTKLLQLSDFFFFFSELIQF